MWKWVLSSIHKISSATNPEIFILKQENSSLKKENSALKKKISELESCVTNLEKNISEDTNHENLLNKYDHDTAWEYYINKKDNKPYCFKCLHEKKEIPLVIVNHSTFKCKICGEYYNHPDPQRYTDNDPNYGI